METQEPRVGEWRLVGLDVGSTTSSLLVASARLIRNCVTGRNELGEVAILFRPAPVFTPFNKDELAIEQLARQLDDWLAAAGLNPQTVTSGGALVTGLAARATNAAAVRRMVRDRFPQSVVARADDPCLESWLAFMGNSLALSRAEPTRPFINLDIGGGTTNIALGRDGEVGRCGCYYVGARHVQVEPGTYRIRSLSPFAKTMLSDLRISAQPGDELTDGDLRAILEFYVGLLEAVVVGRCRNDESSTASQHTQVEFVLPADAVVGNGDRRGVVTLSGGVGELAYRCAQGLPLPDTTSFGDLGIDLARRLCESPVLSRDLRSHVPAGLGRATVHGLTVHSTEVSGATLYLPRPELLPLADLPILGSLDGDTTDADLCALLDVAARCSAGVCLRVRLPNDAATSVRALGTRLAVALERFDFPASKPLVLLAEGNIGKSLGHYATRWGQAATSLIVLDEMPARIAHLATIGAPHEQLVPVSLYGLAAQLDERTVDTT
ncbi:MAG: reactivating factor for ethanolamine ammonia lyase [Planctomycetaceae bacterium]|nr:reactivating factor for ethanolamine ammonia lyase [Planctomycetaceae bacterium]